MNDNLVFLRQLGLVTPHDLDFPITVIGAGGIGSWATLALAKMGCRNITVVDFDKVENKNTPSQIYTLTQKGMFKVNALADAVKSLTGIVITPLQGKIQDKLDKIMESKVIICGVDSLEERKSIWDKILSSYPPQLELYIDARMGGEFMRFLTVNSNTKDAILKYTKIVSAKTTPVREECTARSVVYNTFVCGGIIASLVKKFAKSEQIRPSINFDLTSLALF